MGEADVVTVITTQGELGFLATACSNQGIAPDKSGAALSAGAVMSAGRGGRGSLLLLLLLHSPSGVRLALSLWVRMRAKALSSSVRCELLSERHRQRETHKEGQVDDNLSWRLP